MLKKKHSTKKSFRPPPSFTPTTTIVDLNDKLSDEEYEDDIELNANDIRYSDFFDPPKRVKINDKPKISIDGQNDEEEEEGEEYDFVFDLDQENSDDEEEEPKSKFQKQYDKIQNQIKQMEIENASANDRPINSLLEEDLEFDHIVKPIPVITEEVIEKLEDMIKRRILDETFDDVERKSDPKFRPFLPSSHLNSEELSVEKSKKSLAEIYEEEFVKQTKKDDGDKNNNDNEKDSELTKEHKEIENMFKNLCHKLDALNVPAINMEEVIPVNVSDATLLAPEEVYDKKKSEVKSKTEMSTDEKKRAHSAKKRARKKQKLMKEHERKVIEKLNPGLGNKYAKQKVMDSLMDDDKIEGLDHIFIWPFLHVVMTESSRNVIEHNVWFLTITGCSIATSDLGKQI
ncbi:6969_t:CDS:10 [Entrophospora sp. SA101]|nr:2207_t:CDS:10 [Entrophospora sp. SA101]CAJ0830615.1 6969_t:CDS:10 [Entrophospora sp. SA101]